MTIFKHYILYKIGKKKEKKLQDQEDWLKNNSIEKFHQHNHWKYDKGNAASKCEDLANRQ